MGNLSKSGESLEDFQLCFRCNDQLNIARGLIGFKKWTWTWNSTIDRLQTWWCPKLSLSSQLYTGPRQTYHLRHSCCCCIRCCCYYCHCPLQSSTLLCPHHHHQQQRTCVYKEYNLGWSLSKPQCCSSLQMSKQAQSSRSYISQYLIYNSSHKYRSTAHTRVRVQIWTSAKNSADSIQSITDKLCQGTVVRRPSKPKTRTTMFTWLDHRPSLWLMARLISS